MTVFDRMREDERPSYVDAVKRFTGDKLSFVEQMEKTYEIHDVKKRRKEVDSERVATEEEYDLGVYSDFLESQVRSAVLKAYNKGYLTFQSGFKEKNDREQFMDFWNRNINIPKETVSYLRKKDIDIKIEKFDDRTTLTLIPNGYDVIRLSDWKDIWDTLISSLPEADTETVPNMKAYDEHVNFRRNQNRIRRNNR